MRRMAARVPRAAGREGGWDSGEVTSLSAAVLPLKPAEAPPAEVTQLAAPLSLSFPPPAPSLLSLPPAVLSHQALPSVSLEEVPKPVVGVAGQPVLRSQATAWCGAGAQSRAGAGGLGHLLASQS